MILLISSLWGDNKDEELILYTEIFTSLFQKKVLLVYADEKSKIILKKSGLFKIILGCKSADFIIGKNFDKMSKEEKCKEKLFFATSYIGFKNSKNCFGAFYWKKGRPQIKFRLEIIEKFNLNLPKNFRKYAE